MPPPVLVPIALLAVVAGAVAAVAGFGIGSLLTPAIALMLGTRAAVAVVAVPHAVATAVRLWALRASVDQAVLLQFGLASAVGGLTGAILQGAFGNPLLTAALGCLLIVSGTVQLAGRGAQWRLGATSSIGAGLLSGLFGGLVGNQGGIRSAALLHFDLPPDRLVGTATAVALLVDAVRLPIYIVTSGAAMVDALPIVLVTTAGVLVGTLVGVPIVRRMPEPTFRTLLGALLLILGIGLVAGVALDRLGG